MLESRTIKTALVSVYHKEGLDEILELLARHGVKFISTGGTADYLESKGLKVKRVETITDYPAILGGRVKTLHPKIFGGILARRANEDDLAQLEKYEIEPIDLVIVDLYPFENTVRSGASRKEVIEKIDIGGISLIRAAAKNYRDVAVVGSQDQYQRLYEILKRNGNATSIDERRNLASYAFGATAHYDTAIFSWFTL